MIGQIPADFDPETYLIINPDVAAACMDAQRHYSQFGHREGRKYKLDAPNALSDPQRTDESNNPEILLDDRELIEKSGLFDEQWYRSRVKVLDLTQDAISHYLTGGETAGFSPSRHFDPRGYKYINADIGAREHNALVHYLRFGRYEGRARSIIDEIELVETERTSKDFIVVIFHECSRTGAPILGWNIIEELKDRYRTIALVKISGPLLEAIKNSAEFCIELPENFVGFPAQCDILAKSILELYNPKYVIANSVETRCFVPSFANLGVPSLALVHEFANYDWIPRGSLADLFQTSTEIVFSSKLVADNCIENYPELSDRSFSIFPQGRSILPIDKNGTPSSGVIQNGMLPDTFRSDGSFIVCGVGRVTHRKGVDLFITTAARLYQIEPEANIGFVWIGGWDEADIGYVRDLERSITDSGLQDKLMLVSEMTDLAAVYQSVDLLFLSSRLDPMPNVSIDALCEGIPIICFASASGIADILSLNAVLADCVIPSFDVSAAARQILRLSKTNDGDRLSQELLSLSTGFAMKNYVEKLDDLIMNHERSRVR